MKKNIIMGLAAALLLASCGGAASSESGNSSVISNSQTESSAVSDSELPSGSDASGDSHDYDSGEEGGDASEGTSQSEGGWTADEEQIMMEALYGIVLPYIDMTGLTISYEDDTFMMEGGRLGEGRLASIASLFTEEDGWEGLDISMLVDAEDGSIYAFEKAVETDMGDRYIRVVVYGYDEDNETFDEYGYFALEAFDPYLYEFPTEFVTSIADYFGSEDVIPAINASFYEVGIEPIALMAYYESDKEDGGYSALLTAAGWDIEAEQDELGFYIAHSPDGVYQIDYLYSAELGGLLIYFEFGGSFPAALVAEFLSYNEAYEDFEFPAFDVEGATYDYFADVDDTYGPYFVIDVYGADGQDLSDYLDTLETLGYTVEYYPYYDAYMASIAIESEGLFTIYLSYYEQYGAIELYFYLELDPLPITEWPAEDIADIVAQVDPDSQAVVPALDGADSFEYGYSTYGYGYIYAYGDASLEEYYAGVLEDAGWTFDGVQYIAPTNDLAIQLNYDPSYEDLDIYLLPYTAPSATWPAEEVSEAIGAKAIDTLPAFEGENNGFTFLDDSYGTAVVVNVEAGTEDTAIADYLLTLVNAGYNPSPADEDVYLSPNGEISVYVSTETVGTITIDFAGDPWLKAVDEFPLDDLNKFLSDYGLGIQLEAPLDDAPDGVGYLAKLGYYDYYGFFGYYYYEVSVLGNMLVAWADALEPTFAAAGYTFSLDYSDSVTYVYINGSTEIDIYYDAQTNETTITFWEP